MKPMNTFYDTLQVSRSANDAALQAAFKTLCEKYHPDKDPGDLVGATPEMLQLSEAYAVLSDSDKRFAYDLSLTKREREMRAEEEAKAAKAASSMFPPIVMPPDFPELPDIPPLPTAPAATSVAATAAPHAPAAAPGTAKVQSTPVHHPSRTAPKFPPPASTSGSLDFAPTIMESSPSEKSGFVDTRPQGVAAPLQVCTVRETPVPVRGNAVVEWLRERPAALLGVVVLGIAVIALAPWMLRVFHMATQPAQPITPDIHPTYVEPPVEPALAASAVVPAGTPAVAAEAGVSNPAVPAVDAASAATATSAAVVAAAAATAAVSAPAKAARSPKRAVARKTKPAAPAKAPEPQAPSRPAEPEPAPPVYDPGGHSGFAPKCRWVTPVKWSCN